LDRRRILSRETGFTLMELLVSMVVLALAMSIVYETFGRASAAVTRTERFVDINHASRFILRTLADDLSSASVFRNNKAAFFKGEKHEMDGGARMDRLAFTGYGRRLASPGAAPDQAVISWFAVENPDGEGYILMRSEHFNVFEQYDQEKAEENSFDITDRIISFQVSFSASGAADQQWEDEYSSERLKSPPGIVNIKLTLKGDAGEEITRSAIIPVGEKL